MKPHNINDLFNQLESATVDFMQVLKINVEGNGIATLEELAIIQLAIGQTALAAAAGGYGLAAVRVIRQGM